MVLSKELNFDPVAVDQIVTGNVDVEVVNDENCPIKAVEEKCRGKQAIKVSEDSHSCILAEIVRREQIEI